MSRKNLLLLAGVVLVFSLVLIFSLVLRYQETNIICQEPSAETLPLSKKADGPSLEASLPVQEERPQIEPQAPVTGPLVN